MIFADDVKINMDEIRKEGFKICSSRNEYFQVISAFCVNNYSYNSTPFGALGIAG